jgi:preprotein translocase subunit SecA
MRIFGTEKIKKVVQNLGMTEGQAIRSKMISKSIETAQKKVEGNNFDMRKSLLDYDNVVNEQRTIIYERRNEILDNENIHDSIVATFKSTIRNLVESHIEPEGYLTEDDKSEIIEFINTNYLKNKKMDVADIIDKKDEEIIEELSERILSDYEKKISVAPNFQEFERAISLRIVDSLWVEHISAMEHLKEGIMLRGYGQVNPLQAYTMEGFDLFEELLNKIDEQIAEFLLKASIEQNTEIKQTITGIANDGKQKAKSVPKKNEHKVGRNDPCVCGSGKKYKNCCGK